MIRMMNAINPARPQIQLIADFTVASITMATSKIVATSFQIRNCCDEYLKTPIAYSLYIL